MVLTGLTKATSTTRPPQPLGHYQFGFHTFLLFLAVGIILHNALVLLLYWKRPSLRSVTNLILVSTACADLSTGLLLIPFLVSSAALSGRGPILNPLYFTSNVVSDFLTIATVGNLLLVTTERYISLCHPYTYPRIARRSMVKTALGSLWLLSFVLAVVPLLWSYEAVAGTLSRQQQSTHVYSVVLLITAFFIPSGIMLFALVSMFVIVKKFADQDAVTGLHSGEATGSGKKAVLIFFAMFVNLLICWSPLIIVRLIVDTTPWFAPGKEVLETLFTLRCMSSLFNPVIYVWCKADYKLAVITSFRSIYRNSDEDARKNNLNTVRAEKSLAEAQF